MSSEEVTRRKALELFGAAAATGATGCLGGGSESPNEDNGPEPVENEESGDYNNGNDGQETDAEYQRIIEENELSPPGEEMIEIYCTEMDSEMKSTVTSWMKGGVETFEIDSIDFEREGEKYFMIKKWEDPYSEGMKSERVLLNGESSEKGGEVDFPDSFASNYVELHNNYEENFETVEEILAKGPNC